MNRSLALNAAKPRDDRRGRGCVLVAGGDVVIEARASAASCPDGPMQLVDPRSAGSGSDFMVPIFAEALTRRFINPCLSPTRLAPAAPLLRERLPMQLQAGVPLAWSGWGASRTLCCKRSFHATPCESDGQIEDTIFARSRRHRPWTIELLLNLRSRRACQCRV